MRYVRWYTVRKKIFSRRLKAASMEFGLWTCPEDCSRRTDQQWQKPSGRRCWVGDVVRAVDFAQLDGDVSGWTRKHSEQPFRSVRLFRHRWAITTSLNVTRSRTSSQWIFSLSSWSRSYLPCRWWRARQHWTCSKVSTLWSLIYRVAKKSSHYQISKKLC